MTTDVGERSPETPGDLNVAIKLLLRAAHDNGVDVERGLACRNGDRYPDWDVIITEVRKPDETE